MNMHKTTCCLVERVQGRVSGKGNCQVDSKCAKDSARKKRKGKAKRSGVLINLRERRLLGTLQVCKRQCTQETERQSKEIWSSHKLTRGMYSGKPCSNTSSILCNNTLSILWHQHLVNPPLLHFPSDYSLESLPQHLPPSTENM